MTWGVNLGADNITNAVNMAKAIMKAFSSNAVQQSGVQLDLIEIGAWLPERWRVFADVEVVWNAGNEADLYKNNGLRPSNWTVEEYVPDWISIAGPVAQAAGLYQGGCVSFQGASFAGQGFTPTEIFNLGILDSAPGQLITV